MIFNTSRGAEAFWKFGNPPGLRVSLMRLLRGQYLRAAPAARGNGSLGSIFMRGRVEEWELLGEGAGFCSRTSALIYAISVLAESNYTQLSL